MGPGGMGAGLTGGAAMWGRGRAAWAASPPPMTFITGLINVEDMVRAPGTPWIIASGLADGERTDGHIYLVNARNRSVRALLPGHVDYRPDANAYPACPGKPDEAKFSAHGLSLRRGPQGDPYPLRGPSRRAGIRRGVQAGRAPPDPAADLGGLRALSRGRLRQRRRRASRQGFRRHQLHGYARSAIGRQDRGGPAGPRGGRLSSPNPVADGSPPPPPIGP